MTLPSKGPAYQTLIAGREFIALDIETTTVPVPGTRKKTTHPISIGAVVLLNGTRRATFHTLINPGVEVDDASSAYNGITTADLTSAPDTATALANLDAFLTAHPDALLVCHNARFDIGHLSDAYDRENMTAPYRDVLDTQFMPVRLHLPGATPRSKLTDLAATYNVSASLGKIPVGQRRLHKALKDAQDTAEVLCWMLAEAAAQGITDFADFLDTVKPTVSVDLAGTGRNPHQGTPTAAPIPVAHIKRAHQSRKLPKNPGAKTLDTWRKHLTECVALHCPYALEKVTVEAHRPTLLPLLTTLLSACANPGDTGTLLGAIEPLLARLDRKAARAWYRTNHTTIKAAPACDRDNSCPSCIAGQPCPKDTVVQLLTRRALDYGTTSRGKPVSLFSRQVKDDLWDTGNDRKMDTWPAQGMHDMAAHMMWILIEEARRMGLDKRRFDILAKAIDRDLHEHDPRLALEVAKHWEHQGRDTDIDDLAEVMRGKATTDVGYIELDMWYTGPHQRALDARAAGARRKARPTPKGLRRPAPVELRPAGVRHSYRYRLNRETSPAP